MRIKRKTRICRKIGYPTRKAAGAALRMHESFGHAGMTVYKCRFCEGGIYHIGHPKGRLKKKME